MAASAVAGIRPPVVPQQEPPHQISLTARGGRGQVGSGPWAIPAGACALAAAALWRLDPGPWLRPRASSVSLALRLAAAQALLLTLCLANTPQRVAWYAVRVPGLDLLARADNAMSEYGFRHHLPGIGDMKSRLTLAELEEQDRARAGEVAELLDRCPEGWRSHHEPSPTWADETGDAGAHRRRAGRPAGARELVRAGRSP